MASGQRTRILVVDDSAVMRSLLRSVVCSDPGLEVAGTAGDGETALSAIQNLRPDLVLLDVEMPVMDGLVTLRKLRAKGHKMPVIMCSSLTQRGAKVTIEALACGASDYVGKPAGQVDRQAATKALSLELIPKILALTSQQQPTQATALRPPLFASVTPLPKASPISSVPVALAIGVSTGGPAALDILLPALPANFPLPVLIVQHMPELFTKLFAERLNSRCPLRVLEAAEGMPVSVGTIYIAKGNWHMEVLAPSRIGFPNTLHLTQGAPENHCRPAVDVLFRSVAAVYGAGALAVVLTGMGSDGMLGCRVIRERGGSVMAQDQASSTVWGMPGAVTNAGLAQKVLPLTAIAPEILRLANRTHSEARELREMVV
ncbi:MAG: chemotaxis response regulator protein-glutamate methylesterase [Terracidiphilus sp.]